MRDSSGGCLNFGEGNIGRSFVREGERTMKKWGKRILLVLLLYFAVTRISWFFNDRKLLPPKEERVYGVSQIWKQAADFYGLWELTDEDLDWDQAYETARKEALAARTSRDYYLTLKKFLAHLHDGHADGLTFTGYNPAQVYLPFGMEYMDGQYVITMTADEKKCPLGAVVETAGGMETGVYLEKEWGDYLGLQTPESREAHLCYFLRGAGKRGQKLNLGLLLEDGTRKETTVKWKQGRMKYRSIQFKEYGDTVYSSDAFDVVMLEGNLAWVKFKTQRKLDYADEYFEKVVLLLADRDGVIMDVRDNAGGNSMVGRTILESFKGEKVPYGQDAPDSLRIGSLVSSYWFWNTYEKLMQAESGPDGTDNWMKESVGKMYDSFGPQFYESLQIGESMYRGRFHLSGEQEKELAGMIMGETDDVFPGEEGLYDDQVRNSPLIGKPMILLVGVDSGSATDRMAAEAKAAGFTLLGTRTRGATGNVIQIPAGGRWMARISTQRGLTPDGKDINNNGIEANVRVEQNLEDLRNGIDTQLEQAMKLLQ